MKISMPTEPTSRLSEAEFQKWIRNYSAEKTLATGESVRVRAARLEDRARLLDHLQHLSPESLRFRFFAIKEDFSEQLIQLADADFVNVVVLLATAPEAGEEQVKGFAAYTLVEPLSPVAELAITVADADHHHGIGTLLLEHLILIARAAGVAVLEATVLSQNRPALAVLAHHGFRAESYEIPTWCTSSRVWPTRLRSVEVLLEAFHLGRWSRRGRASPCRWAWSGGPLGNPQQANACEDQ